MGDVRNLNNPTLDVLEALDGIKEEVVEREIIGAIVLLINPDDSVSIATSHQFTIASFLGYCNEASIRRSIIELADMDE